MEEQLLKESIEVLKKQKRPEKINALIYGQYEPQQREFIYSDANHQYDYEVFNYGNKEVRSVKAFAKVISEELKRRNNPTGYKATVSVNLDGGYFIPDDNTQETKITFNRLNSQQWNLIKRNINKDMNHRDFLLFLQAIKPSLEYFDAIYKSYAMLRLVGKTELTSNPVITESGEESGYKCTYRLEDGTDGEENFPTGFLADVQFAKAGDKRYPIPIDLLFYRNEDNEIRITVLCPIFENIEEQAIIDEADYIKEKTKEFNELLVLSDF